MYSCVCFFFLSSPPCCGGGGEWVGCVDDGVKAGGHSQTKGDTSAAWDWDTIIPPPDTSSPPFLPLPKTKNKTNKHCHSNPPLPPPRGQCIPYQGWPHQPLHKHAHTQSHTAASQSLCPGEVCFCFFFVFFFPFLSFFLSSGVLFFYCWGKGKDFFIVCVCIFLIWEQK